MSKQKSALITGITGQTGSYLAELLLSKGYVVHGIVRHASTPNTSRIDNIINFVTLHDGDLTDVGSLVRIIQNCKPCEIYNLAAQSFVKVSWDQPIATADVTGIGALRMLEAIRIVDPTIRFYQASSSELFGKVVESPQSEKTPFYPRSPYGVAKLFAHWSTINYRESYNMFACCGIIFNHESPRRGFEFVTRKITDGVAKIVNGITDKLYLGNLDARRDWSHASDMADAIWLMLQQNTPNDYVFSSGEMHSVRDFVDVAFKRAGLDYTKYVVVDPKFMRPAEVDLLVGDSSLARNELGWNPRYTFLDIVNEMVDHDLSRYL